MPLPEEIEDAITDGPDDRGIDAIFVDEGDGRNVIHLFQFKHVGSFAQAKKNFPSTEIDKLLSFCADVLSQESGMRSTCNPILWTKVQEIWAALRNPAPSFEVHFCGNMNGLTEPHKQRVASALAGYRSFTVNHQYSRLTGQALHCTAAGTDRRRITSRGQELLREDGRESPRAYRNSGS